MCLLQLTVWLLWEHSWSWSAKLAMVSFCSHCEISWRQVETSINVNSELKKTVQHSRAPVSTWDTFQDLLQVAETTQIKNTVYKLYTAPLSVLHVLQTVGSCRLESSTDTLDFYWILGSVTLFTYSLWCIFYWKNIGMHKLFCVNWRMVLDQQRAVLSFTFHHFRCLPNRGQCYPLNAIISARNNVSASDHVSPIKPFGVAPSILFTVSALSL